MRRKFLWINLILMAILALVVGIGGPRLTGDWHHHPQAQLSVAAQQLVERTFAGLDRSRRLDVHVHLAGIGTDGSGCTVHPHMRSWLHPKDYLKFTAYLDAAGITALEHVDRQFAEQLVQRARKVGGHLIVLPFDRRMEGESEFYVPNAWAQKIASEHPDLLIAGGSVHPYRPDAVAELEKLHAAGVRLIKWLPNAQGIDPASERCDAFYAAMARLDMVLLSHTGREAAVEAEADQALGNPLRLRRPLRAGVRVIAAHFASLGEDADLDAPGQPRVASWRLLLRMLEEPAWRGRLFVDTSALTMTTRVGEPLRVLLARPELQERLVYGSDWPLPAVNVLYRVRQLAELGLIDEVDVAPLREVYHYDPLLFDLALQRAVRDPVTRRHLPPEVFVDRLGILGPR